ncbi:flavodoxin [Enterococcus saccharolyticus]|uniref:flavodoxin n=1 Tax=Enterococcus TaxID=1350 RepID=UPI001E34D9DE|nr:flavodoxin [Enterococcus saccharolyticus]MCD5003690.1 flavodoxin [Enterococcus saccharolyticus]
MLQATIIYASLTGNTEEIVEHVTELLEEREVDVTLIDCEDYEGTEFIHADICIIGTYTYGEGELPEEIVPVYESIPELDLTGKIFGVCGSGDTLYEEFYCQSIDDFEQVFEQSGAQKGSESVKIDLDMDDEDEERLEIFVEELINK